MRKRKTCVMGLFSDFDEAFKAIADIRMFRIPGVTIDDVTIRSPIEHPDIEEVLGERPSFVPYFTLFGAAFGFCFTFLGIALAQASFLVMPQGGKPVITIPSNLVLSYEMLIMFGVLSTLAGFIIGGRLYKFKTDELYDSAVSLDQIGVIVSVEEGLKDKVKALFKSHDALEIREGSDK